MLRVRYVVLKHLKNLTRVLREGLNYLLCYSITLDYKNDILRMCLAMNPNSHFKVSQYEMQLIEKMPG